MYTGSTAQVRQRHAASTQRTRCVRQMLPKKKKNEKRTCYTCGESGHLTRDCPTTRCHYCGREGHIARDCR